MGKWFLSVFNIAGNPSCPLGFPLINRRFKGGTAEPFSKNFLKIFILSVEEK